MASRLKEKFQQEIAPALKEELGIKNVLALPVIDKIVINMGVGKAKEDKKILPEVKRDLRLLSGQQPIDCVAKKSIASFNLREGMLIGCKVTLRKERMYDFLDRLIHIAIPRMKDFRGVSTKAFDKAGHYTLGLQDQTIFAEVKLDSLNYYQGMDVTIVIRNSNPEHSFALLEKMGMPFRNQNN